MLVLFPFAVLNAQQREFILPKDVCTLLTNQYGRWKYADIKIPMYDFKAKKSLGEQFTDLIRGDFNGDGKLDYAGIFVLLDSVEWNQDYLLVLFWNVNTYDIQVLDNASVSAQTIVYLVKAGNIEEDLQTHKKIKYKYDAIGYGPYEKASATIYFENGKVFKIGTGD